MRSAHGCLPELHKPTHTFTKTESPGDCWLGKKIHTPSHLFNWYQHNRLLQYRTRCIFSLWCSEYNSNILAFISRTYIAPFRRLQNPLTCFSVSHSWEQRPYCNLFPNSVLRQSAVPLCVCVWRRLRYHSDRLPGRRGKDEIHELTTGPV